MKYSKKSSLDYFHRTSGIISQPTPEEVQLTCPACGANKLYYNISKQIGLCHKASCRFHDKVFIEDLIEIFGFKPDEYREWEKPEEEKEQKPITLQGYPVLVQQGSQLLTSSEEGLSYLRGRGISDQIILNWGIHCDGRRVYVPIIDNDGNNLVNFNSRLLPRFEYSGKKYLYAPGRKTSHYLLGWKECRDWSELLLVENTFVSLSYRTRMYCTTNFGSHLSNVQADLIADSEVKRVAILWDQGAEANMERAIKKLHERGIKASYWKIWGQPDDYSINWVEEKAKQVLEAADKGINWLDFRDECKQLKEKS